MKLLTKVYVKEALGLADYEKGAEEFAQGCLRRWVASKCGCKKMRGGAPTMPIDYYGIEGAGYVESDAGTPSGPTGEWARPMI
ncbi:hypothetical protein EBT25_19110, partial [bacterium]|nr:hypothetical protein [bacterium]